METKQIRKRPPAQVPARMVCHGVDDLDFAKLIERTEKSGEDWVKACEELGNYDFAHAKAELQKGRRLTARYFFLAAESLFRIGQYGIHEVTEEKLHLNSKLCDAFARAAALFDPPLEEVIAEVFSLAARQPEPEVARPPA